MTGSARQFYGAKLLKPPPWQAVFQLSSLPPPSEKVTVPYGIVLSVRLLESVNSDLNQPGDKFVASLASPVMVGDRVVIPAEAGLQGKIVKVRSAGRFTGRSSLVLELTRLAYNGKSYQLRTSQYSKQGPARDTRSAETIGGGAGRHPWCNRWRRKGSRHRSRDWRRSGNRRSG